MAREGLARPRKPETVCRWVAKYRAGGLAALAHRPRGHRGLSPLQGAALVELVRQDPARHGLERARWRLADLRAALAGYSLGGVARALRRRRVRLKRGRLRRHSPDPAYAAKRDRAAKAVALAREFPGRVTTVFGDEVDIDRQPTQAATWDVVGSEPTADHSHRANTRHRICGGLDAVTGQVVWRAGSKARVALLRRWLADLRAAYPDHRLLLVWDNWPVHRHPDVLARAAQVGIGIVWLPTYAPWRNPIEQRWRQTKQDVLHHHRLADAWDHRKARVHAHLDRSAHASPALLRYVGRCPV